MNKDIQKLVKSINRMQEKIRKMQSLCQHNDKTSKHGSNTGNLSEVDDMYWTNHVCNECGKIWTDYHKPTGY